MTLELPVMGRPRKRSITVDGHPTSVSLEDAFWKGLQQLARAHGLSMGQVIAIIDRARPPDVGLATAIRLTVLAGCGNDQGRSSG